MIRGNKIGCPFGLDIPEGCLCAGGSVSMMTQISDLKGDALSAATDRNNDLMLAEDTPLTCIYADIIIEDKDVVDCKYNVDSDIMPAGNVGLNGSPYYPHLYSGNVSEKIQGEYPVKNYSDNNHNDGNPYLGLFSLI